jgi:hypothetical protein
MIRAWTYQSGRVIESAGWKPVEEGSRVDSLESPMAARPKALYDLKSTYVSGHASCVNAIKFNPSAIKTNQKLQVCEDRCPSVCQIWSDHPVPVALQKIAATGSHAHNHSPNLATRCQERKSPRHTHLVYIISVSPLQFQQNLTLQCSLNFISISGKSHKYIKMC